ncbi:TetR/AcrR family transcriptional regulator [Actinoplanes sp. TFC3]|uniref:TetR/AcrR family transcriptional regulator n=1 Tax=Actinoplanes sp. TFC3 TaxID=1710355 RepID=UPI00082CC942|nr:TetR/AcrR family transcriptional regulator [Actinoplanes sp. TFC3]
MPTGVALRDVREQLFAAAERVLLRDGPYALTSRAVTTEAGVAKGVLHRYFTDFDAFLAELVLDRTAAIRLQEAALRETAGDGDIVDTLTRVLTDLFTSVAAAIVALVIARDELRARLRETTPVGVPMLIEATGMVAGYLAAEQDRGRIRVEADVNTLALTLIGSGHLISADRTGTRPGEAAVHKVVATVLAGVIRGR